MNIAIILFPGTNCEKETKAVFDSLSVKADIVRWNEDEKKIASYDGYVLPGGWSYEDRIRAGVIAAKTNIINILKEQDEKGKPILGICNGCQVLVEAGMVPKLDIEKVEMAVAPNINPKLSGFYCTWINLKKVGECAFTKNIDEILAMPIAHAEGRFVTSDQKILDKLEMEGQVVFKYCDNEGKVLDKFPINPNGSVNNIAGICNKKGNVMAMMPHPERASFNRQHKRPMSSYEDGESQAGAIAIFKSMVGD